MDERVKEIELALKNAVHLDTGSKERGPIVAFHRDDITYLLNCIQRVHELEEGIEAVWPLFDPRGPVTFSQEWSVAWRKADALLCKLLDKTRKEG